MKRVLITSAIPSVNGVKHLGNLVGSMLPADVYARYLRNRGHEVLYICATDDHGTPAELGAIDAGMDVATYCDEQWRIQSDLAQRWALSFDHFGRSSSPQNEALTIRFYDAINEHGLFADRVTKQMYSATDGRFLPDRYVIGTCPHCAFDRARGDQCENCTRVLDPALLVDPRSAISGATDLEMRDTQHLHLQLDKLADRLRVWIQSQKDWPLLTTSIALKWLNEGLRERAITRDLKWGFAVPREGYEGKVFYVWFDAPIGYIGATVEWADADPSRNWRSWWYDSKDVTYVQFMGKDNVPFHTIMWPGMIMGTGEPWKQADYIKSYSWLTYEGGKFSTSQGRGIFMNDALDLLPADYWRWYLMSNAPESDDSDFTWEAFATDVNKGLGGTIGNFVNRTLKLSEANFGAAVPAGGVPGMIEEELAAELAQRIATYNMHCDNIELRKAAGELYLIWSAGNVYLTKREPWKSAKSEDPTVRAEAAMALRTAINLIRLFAILAEPFIPASSQTILAALGASEARHLDSECQWWPAERTDVDAALAAAPPGQAFEIPPVLFPRVEPEQVAAWKAHHRGGTVAT